MNAMVKRYSLFQEINIWWVVQGELAHDLLVYYTICSIAGFIQGYNLGLLMIGRL